MSKYNSNDRVWTVIGKLNVEVEIQKVTKTKQGNIYSGFWVGTGWDMNVLEKDLYPTKKELLKSKLK